MDTAMAAAEAIDIAVRRRFLDVQERSPCRGESRGHRLACVRVGNPAKQSAHD
jgi:hypothetical protein